MQRFFMQPYDRSARCGACREDPPAGTRTTCCSMQSELIRATSNQRRSRWLVAAEGLVGGDKSSEISINLERSCLSAKDVS